MKAITIFIALWFLTLAGHSQIAIEDSTITFTSNQLQFSYSPADLFSNISVATNKVVDGQKGIEFFFISKRRQKTPGIRIDSIILTSSTNKTLTLNNPYRDTICYRNDGGLSLQQFTI